jgi:hypothetical protein
MTLCIEPLFSTQGLPNALERKAAQFENEAE